MSVPKVVAGLSACLIAAIAPRGGPARTIEPAAGVLLVAKPSIDGGPFFHSVVLLLSHDEQGTLGLIVNRVSDVGLDEALPELEAPRELPLSFGGPVGIDGLLFLFRAEREPDGVAHVMNDIYFSGDRRVLDELLESSDDRVLRVFIGHSGWAPGQLASEIRLGSWELLAAEPAHIFGEKPEMLWPKLTKAGRVTASVAPAESPGKTTGR